MKLNKIVIASMAVLALAACNKQKQGETPDVPAGQGTYAQLTFVESVNGTTRADSESQNDADGTTAESAVDNAQFFTGTGLSTFLTNITAITPAPTAADVQAAYTSDIFEYSEATGNVNSALVVNAQDLRLNSAAFTADHTIAIADLSKLAAKNKFVMSSAAKTIDIKENVEPNAVAEGNNKFSFDVERVVSKVQVGSKDATITVAMLPDKSKANITHEGTVESPRYSVAGSAKEVYLFADKAGDRAMTPAGDASVNGKVYKNFAAVTESMPLATIENGVIKNRRDLQKVSDKTLFTHDADTEFAAKQSLAISQQANIASTSLETGIYFLENSLPNISGKGAANYSDLTYVKFYAKFVPANNHLYKLNAAGDAVEAVADVATELGSPREETVDVTDEWVAALSQEDKDRIGAANLVQVTRQKKVADASNPQGFRMEDYQVWTLKMTVAANTFFYGETTGKLYSTLNAARVDGNKTGSKVYKAGEMYWFTPANAEKDADGKFYANLDTRRNNIYSLTVNKIVGLGDNWDPRDPEDPNIPKPNPEDNPDEPKKPEDTKVDPVTTNIQVDVRILKWNVVARGIDLK